MAQGQGRQATCEWHVTAVKNERPMKFAVHLSHTCRPTHWHWWRSTSYRFEIQGQMVGQVGPDRWYYSALQTRIAETLNQWHRPKVPFWVFNLENSKPMRLDRSEFPRHLEKPCFRFHWRFWLLTQKSQYNKNQFFYSIKHIWETHSTCVMWPWWGNPGHSCLQHLMSLSLLATGSPKDQACDASRWSF